jgi:hypothetical protein
MERFNVAFVGHMGSGKSTAANELIKLGYVKVSFADALKKLATEACGMKEKNRELLQKLGVGIRQIDPDFWVKAAFQVVKGANSIYKPVVIDDLRFPNELKACQENDFKVFRVVRDRDIRISSFGLDPGVTYDFEGHISETALDSVELPEINSNMDIQSFRESVNKIVQELESYTAK